MYVLMNDSFEKGDFFLMFQLCQAKNTSTIPLISLILWLYFVTAAGFHLKVIVCVHAGLFVSETDQFR